MGFHFTQTMSIRKTGFGNSCMAELGTPTPIADELLAGSRLVSFDEHPYLARSGWGNMDGSDFPEQAVSSCTAALVVHYNGLTKTSMSMDFSTPTFWGIYGLDKSPYITLDNNVTVNSTVTEISFEVDYDSSVYTAFDISRVSFQYVNVEKDGRVHEFRNVACLPISSWRNAVATFRMWGQTYSWGSEKEKFLTIPFKEVRRV